MPCGGSRSVASGAFAEILVMEVATTFKQLEGKSHVVQEMENYGIKLNLHGHSACHATMSQSTSHMLNGSATHI